MANRPTFNPGKLDEYAFIGSDFLNPSISLIFDPGSTFKIITMAAGLDSGTIGPQSTHNLPGTYEYWGLEFRNWDERTYPNQTMTNVLANSSNTGAIYVANRLGPDKFYEYVRAFGFGRNTGVDLAGEVPGILKARGHLEWRPSDLAANSFGQSISVTPLQLAAAFGAVANRGKLIKPRVVKRWTYKSGASVENEPQTVTQVIRPDTAKTLMEMMYDAEHAVLTNLALSEKYSTVGKTGTAEIPDRGRILPEQTIASYLGFGPVDAPRVLILVKIDRPQKGTWGSQVASPIFRALVDRIFSHLRIKPERAD
jgi:cell division protein FtsI/penicillin-binding protein 2